MLLMILLCSCLFCMVFQLVFYECYQHFVHVVTKKRVDNGGGGNAAFLVLYPLHILCIIVVAVSLSVGSGAGAGDIV